MADIDDVEKIADPAERAREVGRRMAAIPELHTRLKAIRQAAVIEMKNSGMSFADIGRELGLHRNRIQQILAGRSAGGQGGSKVAVEDEPASDSLPAGADQLEQQVGDDRLDP